MKFLHCADIHLGKTLGGNKERYRDFFSAFSRVINLAIDEKIDFMIMAGDLFQEGSIAPSTLADTMEILEPMKQAKIPIIAIEGNHDLFRRRKDESWLHFLSRRGYLKLLRPTMHAREGKIEFQPYNEENAVGGWIDINGFRICGIGYYGASTNQMLALALDSLPDKSDIGIFHGGVWHEHILKLIKFGGVTPDEIMPLKERFRYLALGHGHRPYSYGEFAYNPGALEVVNREEANREDSDRGCVYMVEMDGENKKVETLHIPRRPYLNMRTDVEGANDFDEVMEKCIVELKAKKEDPTVNKRPVLMWDIVGKVNFESYEIDVDHLKQSAMDMLDPIHVEVFNQTSLIRSSRDYHGESENMDTIFRETILELIQANPRYREKSGDILDLIFDLKREVIENKEKDRDRIIDLIHTRRMKFDEKLQNKQD